METINNVAAAASRVIWGEQQTTTQDTETSNTEPISGQQGKGDINSPYDQGNATDTIVTSTHPRSNTVSKTDKLQTSTPSSSCKPLTRLADRTMNSNTENTFGSDTQGSDPIGLQYSHITNKTNHPLDSHKVGSHGNTAGAEFTGNTDTSHSSNPLSSHSTPSSIPINPHNAVAGGAPKPHQETDKTGVVGGHGDPFKTSDNVASERSSNPGVIAPSSKAELTKKQQVTANPKEYPSTGHEHSAIKESKEDAEAYLKTKDPNDHSGEPMHMHTGSGDGTVPSTQAERRESKVGNPGGQEHGKEVTEGTGEKWVKTSGMAADGGDFDATKPGAGREADRLMEQKGIHKSAPGKPSDPLAQTTSQGSHGDKEKMPLGQKIKEKLHIGSKDK